MPSKNAYSSLCSTFFTINFLAALEERNLSISSIREVSAENVKFVTTWLNQWKRNSGKKMQQVLLITLYYIWKDHKRKDQTWKETPTVRELSISFSRFKNRLYTFKNWLNGWKSLYVKTNQIEKIPLLWLQTVWEKFIRGLTSPDSVSKKITQLEQSPLMRRQIVLRNYSEQMTEKQNNVQTCTRFLTRETTPIYENRCSFDQKGKVVHIRQVWIV